MITSFLFFSSLFLSFPLVLSQSFTDVTSEAGIIQPEASDMFGGPTVGDLDNDGNTDIILTFHNNFPIRVFHGTGYSTFKMAGFSFFSDVHGISIGPRSARTRERLITISVGGGRGANLRPPFIFVERPNRSIREVTNEIGFGKEVTRGRVAVFMDMSLRGNDANRRNGGGPDILFINLLGGRLGGLKQLAYQNVKGKYVLKRPLGIEEVNEERAIVTDIDGDGIMEVVHFSVLGFFKLVAPFKFADVTSTVAPGLGNLKRTVAAVVELDFDNDGDMDLYIARANSNLVTLRGPPFVDMFDDILLLNEGGKYVKAPKSAGALIGTNSMGVSAADFDNDGFVDLAVTTFKGDDYLLMNKEGKRFEAMPLKEVIKPSNTRGHNVMAVDYNNDGRVDFIICQGWRKEFLGRYRLMKNVTPKTSNRRYLLVRVGNEPTRACASINAIVTVKVGGIQMIRRVGGRGAGRGGQSYIETVHFGLASKVIVDKVMVTWTSGYTQTLRKVKTNTKISFGIDL